jgi:hypothetical protein
VSCDRSIRHIPAGLLKYDSICGTEIVILKVGNPTYMVAMRMKYRASSPRCLLLGCSSSTRLIFGSDTSEFVVFDGALEWNAIQMVFPNIGILVDVDVFAIHLYINALHIYL